MNRNIAPHNVRRVLDTGAVVRVEWDDETIALRAKRDGTLWAQVDGVPMCQRIPWQVIGDIETVGPRVVQCEQRRLDAER